MFLFDFGTSGPPYPLSVLRCSLTLMWTHLFNSGEKVRSCCFFGRGLLWRFISTCRGASVGVCDCEVAPSFPPEVWILNMSKIENVEVKHVKVIKTLNQMTSHNQSESRLTGRKQEELLPPLLQEEPAPQFRQGSSGTSWPGLDVVLRRAASPPVVFFFREARRWRRHAQDLFSFGSIRLIRREEHRRVRSFEVHRRLSEFAASGYCRCIMWPCWPISGYIVSHESRPEHWGKIQQ